MTFWWAILAILAVVLLVLAYFVLPGEIVPDSTTGVDRLKARNDVRTTGIQLVGAIVVALGSFLTARTFELNRRGQLAERLVQATELLKEPKTRIGGIQALEWVVRDARGDRGEILGMLSAYVRERVPLAKSQAQPVEVPADIQAVLKILARRPGWLARRRKRVVDLSGLDLRGWQPGGAYLDHANFTGSNLELAVLTGASLRHATFEGETILTQAHLNDVNAEHALFIGANLEGAQLRRARLAGARFSDARLQGANLKDARDARLGDAQLNANTIRPDGNSGP